MKSYAINPNFKYPEIKPEHKNYVFGANNAGEIIRENGDWRDFIPEFEAQRRHGVESSACYIEAQQKAICTILEEEFGIIDSNYSARFNALLSNGTPEGGDPLVGADSIRNDGLIVENMMPFSDDILSWNDYHSWKGADEHACRLAGKQFLKKWKLNNYIVFERHEDVKVKYAKLKEALKRSPVPISIYGWVEKDGVFIKPKGLDDNHLTLCLYVDEQNRPHYLDTYPPYIKIGESLCNSDFAMRYTVKEIPQEEKKSFIQTLFNKDNMYAFIQISRLLEVLGISKREILYRYAKSQLGKEKKGIPDTAPKDVNCVEALNQIGIECFGKPFCQGASTITLDATLKSNKRFQKVLLQDSKPGDIIVSPTSGGKIGHCGILNDSLTIMSNSSLTGLWSNHWELDRWIKNYQIEMGLPVNFYRILI